MSFEEFLPKEKEEPEEEILVEKLPPKIGQEQFYDVVTGRQPDWHTIIYDLINSEQLDPWDIDIVLLTRRYFEKILELEENAGTDSDKSESPDFYISSKVLLAAALLLRIKSEFLLNRHIQSIDDILFGKKDEKKYIMERIEINEDDLPVLIPKTPLPRARKITLDELMAALSKAINTESRRIKKEVAIKRAKKLSEVDFPSFRKIDLKDRIKRFYARILITLKKASTGPELELNKTCYSYLVGKDREERLACFLPLLHLSNTKKLWIEQEKHMDEIWIFLYEYFDKNRDMFTEEVLEEDVEIIAEIDSQINEDASDGENLDYKEDNLTKAKKFRDRKKQIAEEARKELENELNIEIQEGIGESGIDPLLDDLEKIEKDSKIEEETGFSEDNE